MRMYKHYSEDGSPIKCVNCSNKHFTDNIKAMIGGSISEVSVTCKRCHNEVGYWAYGYYDPSYYTVEGFINTVEYVLFNY